MTRTARQDLISRIMSSERISSQRQMLDVLHAKGVEVTQATLSRDFFDIGAKKVRVDGQVRYTIADEVRIDGPDKLRRVLGELLVGHDSSGNIAVLRTPPGAAQYVASIMDRMDIPYVVATIAGDDTVFALARDGMSGAELAEYFSQLAQG